MIRNRLVQSPSNANVNAHADGSEGSNSNHDELHRGHGSNNNISSSAYSPRSSPASLLFQRNLFMMVALILGTMLLVVMLQPSECDGDAVTSLLREKGKCRISFGEYKGEQYYSKASGTTGIPKCLVESKWLKLSQHAVQFPGTNKILNDWLWIDYHDRINVLVADVREPDEERQFLVFEQSKYALEGRSSLAIIGGIIEPGEEPSEAAEREVDEEMNGLQCRNFHFLGRFRTDVNRGMGWLNSFLATDCYRDGHHHVTRTDEIGAADTERQDLRRISLSELRDAAANGEFLEVQWTATVGLALQHPELST
jgi:ADP-ribose pyrophosphatase